MTNMQKCDFRPPCTNMVNVCSKKRSVLSGNQCNVCFQTFATMQECLKHDLLEHNFKCTKRRKTQLSDRCRVTWKFLNSPEKFEERGLVHKALENCSPGMELQEIFQILCMNTENLQLLFARIETCLAVVLRSLGSIVIHQFGSIASKLALKDCDVDVYMDVTKMFKINAQSRNMNVSHSFHPNSKWHKIAFNRIHLILRDSKYFSNVCALRGARVPIIKCKHVETGFNIDINLCCPNSVENTRFVESLVNSDKRIHALMIFLKVWAKNMQIVNQGKMSSYCLIVLVIFFLQQPLNNKLNDKKYPPILLSIKDLQENCSKVHYIQGINYAYDFCDNQNNRPKLHAAITVLDLIIEFFNFYNNFNFADYIIAPHLGVAILKNDFITGHFPYPLYQKQLHLVSDYFQQSAEPFQINSSLCVQDPFNLTHNVAKALQANNVEYFQFCLANASYICDLYNKGINCNGNCDVISVNELYEALLYDSRSFSEPQKISCEFMKSQINGSDNGDQNDSGDDGDSNCSNKSTTICKIIDSPECLGNQKSLKIVHVPTRNDLRALGVYGMNSNGNNNKEDCITNILKQWCCYYTKAIEIILSQIYRFDMELQTNSKKIKCENKNYESNDISDNISKTWYIRNSIDLWTNRFHQKSSEQTFMQYQLEQTERLYRERYENCNLRQQYSVDIKALLTVNVADDMSNLELSLTLPDGSLPINLYKKHPLKRFFNIFKCTLDNFNLKEAIQTSLFNNF